MAKLDYPNISGIWELRTGKKGELDFDLANQPHVQIGRTFSVANWTIDSEGMENVTLIKITKLKKPHLAKAQLKHKHLTHRAYFRKF